LHELLTRVSRRPYVVLGSLAALLAIQICPWWCPTPDACAYLSIARSMAAGGPVESLGSPKLHYAPGYPLLISPAFWTGDRPFLLLSIMHWSMAVLFMLGVYRWMRRQFPDMGLWLTCLVMANVCIWMTVRLTLSEAAFLAVMVGTIEALQAVRDARSIGRIVLMTLLASLLMIGLSLVRQTGVFFAAGFGLMMLWAAYERQVSWTRAVATTLAVGIPASLVILGLLRYEARMAELTNLEARTYLDYFDSPDLSPLAQMTEGLRLRISETGRLMLPGMFKTYSRAGVWLNPNIVLYSTVFLVLGWGWWQLAGRTREVFALTLPFYLGIYLIYPYDQGTRYLLPLLPLMVACLWTVLERMPRQQYRVLGVLLACHLSVAVGNSVRQTWQFHEIDRQWPEIDTVASVIGQAPGRVVARKLPTGAREMLQLALDRKIEVETGEEHGDGPVQWIVAPQGAPAYEGFAIHNQGTHLQLQERIASPALAKEMTHGTR
jgi:hypothetical protein